MPKPRRKATYRNVVSAGTFDAVAAVLLSLVLFYAFAQFVQHGWQAATFPYSLDYGEGPMLDHTVRLARGENIYRIDLESPPYVIANYPPLFMLVQVPFLWAGQPALWYGRLISLASAAATAVLLGLTIHGLSRDRFAAAVGSLVFLSIPYIAYWSALDRVDSMALMLSWAGLYVIVRWPNRRWALVLTALLMVAAAFTRQTYWLAAPLAAIAWLSHRRLRGRAAALAATVGSLGLALILVLNALSGGGFFFSVVGANVNEFGWARMLGYLSKMIRHMPYLLAGSLLAVLLAARSRRPARWLLGPYLAAGGLAALLAGKIGSNVNYFFELSAALSLAMGLLLAWLPRRTWRRAVGMTLLAAQIGVLTRWSRSDFAIPSAEEQAELAALEQHVRTADDPVLADEQSGLLPINGRRLYMEPIGMTNLARSGRWDEEPFLEEIRSRAFSLILVYEPYARDRWTRRALDQIEDSYDRVDMLAGNAVYRPKRR